MAKGDGDLRMEILPALEDGASSAKPRPSLEVGLSDLSRKKSVDTLELALRMTPTTISTQGPGKAALARLVTRSGLANRVFEAKFARKDLLVDRFRGMVGGIADLPSFASIVRTLTPVLSSGPVSRSGANCSRRLPPLPPPIRGFDRAMSGYFETIGNVAGFPYAGRGAWTRPPRRRNLIPPSWRDRVGHRGVERSSFRWRSVVVDATGTAASSVPSGS